MSRGEVLEEARSYLRQAQGDEEPLFRGQVPSYGSGADRSRVSGSASPGDSAARSFPYDNKHALVKAAHCSQRVHVFQIHGSPAQFSVNPDAAKT